MAVLEPVQGVGEALTVLVLSMEERNVLGLAQNNNQGAKDTVIGRQEPDVAR